MTLVIEPDYNISAAQRVEWRKNAVKDLRRIAEASSVLGVPVDIREMVVGGSAVTAAQTNLPINTDAGGTSAVDMIIEAASTTTVGWHSAAPGAADTLEVLIGTTQTVTTSSKAFNFYGVRDFTVGGDLQALQFATSNNIKAYIETEAMYESDVGDLIGGHFVDSDTGQLGSIVYGTVNKQPITIKGIWHTNVVKYTALRGLVAEAKGTVITTTAGGVT